MIDGVPKTKQVKREQILHGFEKGEDGSVIMKTSTGDEQIDGLEFLEKFVRYNYPGGEASKLIDAFLDKARELKLVDKDNRFDPFGVDDETEPAKKEGTGKTLGW